MRNPSEAIDDESDAQLLRRSREGDRGAFSELWRRHAPTAVAYARSLGAAPPDPEDVVSDAFVSILQLLRSGRGPEERFRPYLLTTVRNTWMTAARRAPATVPLDVVEPPHSVVGTVDLEAMVDSTALAEAFCSLPERWQRALWLSEVEQLPPREIARVLDMRANAVAALTYRARDGLRKAWISAHLRRAPVGSDHVRVIEMLGAFVQDDLGPRPKKFVADHLASCTDCRAAAGEAKHLARAITLGPLLVGGAGLVIAPAVFPAAQAAATGFVAPVLWPVAAAVAVALSVGGSQLVRTPTTPEPPAVLIPASVPESTAASEPEWTPRPLPAPTSTSVPTIADRRVEPKPAPAPDPTPAPAPAPAPEQPVMREGPVGPTEVVRADPAPTIAEPKPEDAEFDATVPKAKTSPPTPTPPTPTPPTTTTPPKTFRITTMPLSWSVEVSVVQITTDRGCVPTASVSVNGTIGARIAVVIDGQPAAEPAQLDESGTWSGTVMPPPVGGRHTISVRILGEDGAPGDVVAETVFEY